MSASRRKIRQKKDNLRSASTVQSLVGANVSSRLLRWAQELARRILTPYRNLSAPVRSNVLSRHPVSGCRCGRPHDAGGIDPCGLLHGEWEGSPSILPRGHLRQSSRSPRPSTGAIQQRISPQTLVPVVSGTAGVGASLASSLRPATSDHVRIAAVPSDRRGPCT